VTVDAPLDRLPLLVRSGAIIPMGPVVQHTGERPLDEVTLLIYPDGTSRFDLYEDDGRTNAWRQGRHALTPIECVAEAGRVTVRIGPTDGDRSVVPAGRRYLVHLRLVRPSAVTVEGAGDLPRRPSDGTATAGWWTDAEGFVSIRPPAQPRVVIVVSTT
jgi:alpha-glucosidase (family GH31 glycosyl hydrolase)